MKHLTITTIAAAALCGCAHDSYTPAPDANMAMYRSDLMACKTAAISDAQHRRYASGADVAGMFGLGGLAVSAAGDPAKITSGPAQPYDFKTAIEMCMRERGFIANTDNSP